MKMYKFSQTKAFAVTFLLWLTGMTQAFAQPALVCQNYSANITPNNVAVVTAQNLVQNPAQYSSISMQYLGAVQNAITFTCNNVGQSFVITVTAVDSNSFTQTCTAIVTVADPNNRCGTSGTNYQISLTAPVNASTCNACDGQVAITGLFDPLTNNQAPGPYTVLWSDGSNAMQRNDLCPNTPYSVSMTDGNGATYTTNVVVSCNSGTLPNAVCQSAVTFILSPNGVVTVNASQLDGGSTGGQVYLIDGNNYVNSITFSCAQVGANAVTLAVIDTNSGTFGNISTCVSTVYIVDPNNICGSGNTTAPVANCASNLTLDLGSNSSGVNGGYAVLTPQMLNNGSTNAGSMWMIDANGNPNLAYTFSCNDLGLHTFYLIVSNGNNPGTTNALYDTCMVVVNVTDTTNRCGGGGGNYTVIDSAIVDADCNGICNGQYVLGSIILANGIAAPAPYTIVWPNGTVGAFANNLCGNTTYTITIYDAMQNAYMHTIFIGCTNGNPGGTLCVDSSLINPNAVCPTVYAPVCGCDGITYSNDCVAEFGHGVTAWITGACNNSGTNGNLTITVTGSGCDTSCNGAVTIQIPNVTPNNVFAVQWSDGFTQTVSGNVFGGAIATRNNLCPGVYVVVLSDITTGVSYTVTAIVGTVQGCVWPGDADDNTTVNNWDMLPISLTYGESGPVRANATTNWIGQNATDWTTANPIANLPNYKHIDCNGDGIINQLDQAAIQQNYGQSYYRSGSSLSGTVPFYVQSAIANEGDRLSLPINLGAATDIATDVYGVAFTINYDPAIVEAGSVGVDYLSSWLGTNLMDIQFDFSQIGKIEVAVARKDRINTTGFGEIGKFNFTIRDDILRNNVTRNMDLTINNIRLIRNDNIEIGTNPTTAVVTVSTTTAIENNNSYAVAIFPNPANGKVNVRSENAQIETITMYNISGQLVKQLNNVNSNNSSFNVNELSQGVYMIQITTDKGVENRKVVIE